MLLFTCYNVDTQANEEIDVPSFHNGEIYEIAGYRFYVDEELKLHAYYGETHTVIPVGMFTGGTYHYRYDLLKK